MNGSGLAGGAARLVIDAALGLSRAEIACELGALAAATAGLEPCAPLVAETPPFETLARTDAALVVARTADPDYVSALHALAAPLLWDARALEADAVAAMLGDPDGRARLREALASADAVIGLSREARLLIEDALVLGLGALDLDAAIRYLRARTAVVIGEGLGNMIYATPALRWIAERLGAPIDLVIQGPFDDAVPLFAESPWLASTHSGWEFLGGRRYRRIIQMATASPLEPAVAYDALLPLNRFHHYNAEGRFIPEDLLNFIGLEGVFPDPPRRGEALPPPFIRDGRRRRPEPGVVGLANGVKDGAWSKRGWPRIAELAERLKAEGWTVRSFGLPHEAVPGAEDRTGIPMRQAIDEIGRCAAFVGHDGGMCHIAEAIGVPTLWLFGPTAMVKNGPVFAHSRLLTARIPCAPCLYKSDWRRCEQPVCMDSLTLDETLEAFREMTAAAETDPADPPSRRPLDFDLLDFELGAPERAVTTATRADERLRRRGAYPEDAAFDARLAARLGRFGDLDGVWLTTDDAVGRHPDDPLLGFLRAWAAALRPEPGRDAPPPAEFASRARDIAAAVRAGGLDLAETRFVFEALAGAVADAGAPWEVLGAVARDFAPAARGKDGMRFLPDRFIAHAEGRYAAVLPKRGSARSTHSPYRGVERMAALADGPSDEALAALSAPAARAVAAKAGAVRIDVRLDGIAANLPRFAGVLLLTEHISVRRPAFGSLSALLARQLRAMVALGLRPVVVTTGFDDVPEGVLFRDSVGHVQARRDWPESAWDAVVDAVDPQLVLSVDGAAAQLSLPPSLRDRLVALSAPGLLDRRGVRAMTNLRLRLETGLERTEREPTLDALSHALRLSAPFAASPLRAPRRALVMLNDLRDAGALLRLVRATPDIGYHVVTDYVPRTLEPNLTTLPLSEGADVFRSGEHDLFIQFSTGPQTLSGELLSWNASQGPALHHACLARRASDATADWRVWFDRIRSMDDTSETAAVSAVKAAV